MHRSIQEKVMQLLVIAASRGKKGERIPMQACFEWRLPHAA